MISEREILIYLLNIENFTNKTINKIISKSGTLINFWENDEIGKSQLTDKQKKNYIKFRKEEKYIELIENIEKENVKIITYMDENYPKKLLEILDYPKILYLKGTLNKEDLDSIAVVGARKPTQYGKTVTEKITRGLSKAKITIVSGMAEGIDSIAHKVSLENNNRTIAVLGTGIDIIYPTKNRELYGNIINNGCVISEYPLGTKGLPYNFPLRNRIISGLSTGIVITEAKKKSGTLITAEYGLEQGKDIFSVPGNINSLNSEGTNNLIKDGAKLTQTVEDILEEIPEFKDRIHLLKEEKIEVNLSIEEKRIVDYLKVEPKSLEYISIETKIPVSKLFGIMTILEMKKQVRKDIGNIYRLF